MAVTVAKEESLWTYSRAVAVGLERKKQFIVRFDRPHLINQIGVEEKELEESRRNLRFLLWASGKF